jgi:hypothetical protein
MMNHSMNPPSIMIIQQPIRKYLKLLKKNSRKLYKISNRQILKTLKKMKSQSSRIKAVVVILQESNNKMLSKLNHSQFYNKINRIRRIINNQV